MNTLIDAIGGAGEGTGGGAVESVSNLDGTLTIGPTVGAVIASLSASTNAIINSKVDRNQVLVMVSLRG